MQIYMLPIACNRGDSRNLHRGVLNRATTAQSSFESENAVNIIIAKVQEVLKPPEPHRKHAPV